MPNADNYSRSIKSLIESFVQSYADRSIYFESMGFLYYLSTLQYVDGVVGNSSSGLTEAPSFKIGTINIGSRQKGRVKSESVIDCNLTIDSFESAINKLYSKQFKQKLKNVSNPHGDGKFSENVFNILQKIKLPVNIKKTFNDLNFSKKP